MNRFLKKIQYVLGINDSVSNAEKLTAALGGFVGIFLISWVSFYFTGASGAALIVPSMGASAVLVFAVPHGKLSQPWALFGGQLISAAIGVACYQFIPNLFFASGVAVGLAIGAMHIFRCVHPPGGATALAAVIGIEQIHTLGYEFIITPVLLNTMIIFFTALAFNSVFPWRRYPSSLMRFTDVPVLSNKDSARVIDKKHIERAVKDIDLVVDLNSSDLQQIFALAVEHAEMPSLSSSEIKLNHYYTNNKHGAEWSVRHIIDEAHHDDPQKDMVIYRVVEGHGLRSADSCTRAEFAQWAARELFLVRPDKSS